MTHLIPLMIFSFISAFTPGPNNIMILSSGLNFGIQKSIPHWLGVAFGYGFMVLLGALGLGAILTQHPMLQTAIKILGTTYLLYFILYLLKVDNKTADPNHTARPITFFQAAIFQWINPKAWMMLISALGIFSSTKISYIQCAFALSLTFFIMCFLSCGTWLLFGVALQNVLQNSKNRKKFNYLMSALLLLSIVLMFLG